VLELWYVLIDGKARDYRIAVQDEDAVYDGELNV
jgi:hypothetical protein